MPHNFTTGQVSKITKVDTANAVKYYMFILVYLFGK